MATPGKGKKKAFVERVGRRGWGLTRELDEPWKGKDPAPGPLEGTEATSPDVALLFNGGSIQLCPTVD